MDGAVFANQLFVKQLCLAMVVSKTLLFFWEPDLPHAELRGAEE